MRRTRTMLSALALLATLVGTAAGLTREEVMDGLRPYAGCTITRITLAGNDITRDWIITREIQSEMGDPLDLDLIREDIIRLENLAIFGSVIVVPGEDGDGVTLDFQFTEMPWIIPYPALSFTEENGFSVGLGVSSPNFLGRGVFLSASAVVGGVTNYKFKGQNPWITGNHVSAGFEAYHQTRSNQLLDYAETSDKVEVNGGTYLGEHGRLMIKGGFYGVGSDQDGITLDADDYDNLWNGGAVLGLDTRDSWRMPRRGWKNELAVHYFGGNADYVAVDIDANLYLPVGDDRSLATGPLLSLQSGDVGEDVPVYQQYFVGGTNSVRGYEVKHAGKETFGQNQFVYNLEYRWDVVPVRPLRFFRWSVGLGLQVAAFADAGLAWSRAEDFAIDRTRVGYGLGVRLLVPAMEMVRFDLGLSRDGDVVFNFSTGSIFMARRLRVR